MDQGQPPSSSPAAGPRARQSASSSNLSPEASEALAAASAALDAFEAGRPQADTGGASAPDAVASEPGTPAPLPQGRLSIVGRMLVLMLAGAMTAWVYREPLERLVAKWFH